MQENALAGKAVPGNSRNRHENKKQPMKKTILVPTDFSSNAFVAAHYALRVAGDFDSNVHILHAHFPLEIAFRTRPRDHKEEERAEAKAREELQRFIDTLGGIQQGQITYSLVTSSLKDAIREYIEDHPVSLVVMGTHGATGNRVNTLGSNTYDVAKAIAVPLLIVPENTIGVERHKVVFFTNYHKGDVNTLRSLTSLLHGDRNVRCTLVHILGGYKPATEGDRKQLEEWKNWLEEQTGYAGLGTELFPGKDNVEVVNQIIDKLDADLTVLTFVDRHGFFERLFHKSLAKAIVLNPKTPVLLTTE